MASFYESIRDELIVDYQWQMQGYMGITGAKTAEVAFVLVNTPLELLEEEFRKLRKRMALDWNDELYLIEKQKVIKWHTYDDIPEKERICIFKIERNDEKIACIYKKVEECRKWLVNFHNIVQERTLSGSNKQDIPA